MRSKILIVDDNHALLLGMQRLLAEFYDTTAVTTGADALNRMQTEDFDLCLIDLAMPEMDGLELLRLARGTGKLKAAIMMSGSGTIESAVHAVKLGATDFIEKPVHPERLFLSIANTLRFERLANAHVKLLAEAGYEDEMLGTSSALKKVRKLIGKVAPTEASVLIMGENGTGKELVAKAIHRQSRRSQKPYIKLNCGAIPKDLIESELFGHEKGAFTGANAQRAGRFELADGGTLLLDEIGDMPLQMQTKLLRVLQDGEFERVGGSQTLNVDVRVLAATNRDLKTMVKTGEFREDLYYRLHVFPIPVPPLRLRSGDVALIATTCARRAGMRNRGEPVVFTPEALLMLSGHPFPGNVRQLVNLVEQLTILIEGLTIQASDVTLVLPTPTPADMRLAAPLKPLAEPVVASGRSIDNVTEESLEKERLVTAMQVANGKKGTAADILGMSRSTLWRKLRAHGIQADKSPKDDDSSDGETDTARSNGSSAA